MNKLPELPLEMVGEIMSYIPRGVDRWSRIDCKMPITTLRSKRARTLDRIFRFYFEDDITDWDSEDEERRVNGEPHAIDMQFLHVSTSGVVQIKDSLHSLAVSLFHEHGWGTEPFYNKYNEFWPMYKTPWGHRGVQRYYFSWMRIATISKTGSDRDVYALL